MTIKQKQCLLFYLGYYTGSIDGDWGAKSADATRQFQDANGLTPDGVFGAKTEEAAKAAVAKDKFKKSESKKAETKSGDFWDDIEYWEREEFRCQCGGKYCNGFPAEPDEKLVRLVNDLRKKAGRPAHRSSGLRCSTWNAKQGGVSNSRHLNGKALDFYIEGVSGGNLLAMAQADSRTRYAYIIEGQYVHVDVE